MIKIKKFAVGFFGMLVLAAMLICIVLPAMWALKVFGPIAGGIGGVLLLAVIAGIMHATRPESDDK